MTPLTPHTNDLTTVYVVAGGNHVTIALDHTQSGGLLDVIEVRGGPGGGPPPHRHAFAEWFRVLEGELTFTEERGGVIRATHTLRSGGSVFVAPWTYHGTLNLSNGPCRFEVIGQPGMMSGYFAEAGVLVPDVSAKPDRVPPGPAELRDISARWGIEFWTGPIDPGPLPASGSPA
ncbi:MAG TPA: cupin domain-containing protein [Solirubrobacteraceae bacterium]|nr:cupin domain-containing protein [Solirubrobacteraceae bacterium]